MAKGKVHMLVKPSHLKTIKATVRELATQCGVDLKVPDGAQNSENLKLVFDKLNDQIAALATHGAEPTGGKTTAPDHTDQILDIMQEGLVIQDASGAIGHFNAAACTILGLTEDQLLGKT